ncbi:PAS domain S-box protein [Rubrivirga sp. IMCC43871]|uniref:PAS domain-containing sensor histidine kinase n=1 Tax=Rubrivirga sp. IMCC43871 TaxID=3391575 RepID=UPI0039901098
MASVLAPSPNGRRADAETRLRASEESYRTVFELASDAIFVHDLDTGAILDANQKACDLHGCTLDELKALGVAGISDGAPPYDAAHARAYVEKAVAGEPQRFEWLGRHRDGTRFWVEVSLHRVRIAGEDCVLASVCNVDERVRAEAALRRAHAELEERVAARTAELADRTRQLADRTRELEAVFRALPDLYFRMETDGTICDYRAGRQFGLYVPPEQFLGRRMADVLPPPVATQIAGALAEVGRSGEPVDIEYTLPLGDERRDFEARLLPIAIDGRAQIVAVVRDVTERTRAQEALRASEEHFRRLIENASDLISIVDAEGRVRYQSPSVERVLGVPRGTFAAGGSFDRIHPDDLPAVHATLAAALAAPGTPHTTTFRLRHADGSWRVLEATGQTLSPTSGEEGVVVNSRDVTERVEAERALRYQKALLEAEDEASIDGLLVVSEDGRILSHNRRFAELWGLPAEVVAAGDDAAALQAVLDHLVDPEAFLARVAHLYDHPDEEARETLELRDGRVFDRYTAPVRGRAGERYGRIWFFRDVTEATRRAEELEAARHAAEAALADLRRAQARLVQQEKMAGLGRMASGIAHELKNPLNFVTNFAALSVDLADELRAELEADPARSVGDALAGAQDLLDDLAGNAHKIAAHGRRADRIVRAMMDHAAVPSGARDAVDVNGLVAEQVLLAADAWRSRAGVPPPGVTLDLGADAGAVEGVASELARVVAALVTNALDAVAERGAPPTSAVTVRTRRRGGAVELAVEDAGPGVPEPDRAHVFEPFFTTRTAGTGHVGLGLSLARDIVVDGHGGTIEVGARPGGGAVFTVSIPAAP